MKDITAIALVEIKTAYDARKFEVFLNLTKELLDAVNHVHNMAVKLSYDAANPHRPELLKLSHQGLQLILALEQLKKCVVRVDMRFADAWVIASSNFNVFFPQYARMRMFLR